MTDLLIRAVSRYPLRRLARPSAVLAFALALGYGGGFWETFLHHVEGSHEANEPGLLAHWMRDSTLALPLVFCAVWAGVIIARRLIERHRMDRTPVLAGAILAATVAWLDSIVIGLASPLHNTLFQAGHSGPHTFYLVHAGRDALLALAVNLPLAAAVSAALLRTRPWAAPLVDAWRRPRTSGQRLALQGAFALLLVAPVAIFAQNGAQLATAGTGPGQPCPTQAPLRTYDVTAMDVDIPLNRFGDHDPNGKMFTLTSKIAAVKAQQASQHVSIGLKGGDAIQPLVIRANLGDCVKINFTNSASGGDYGMHIDGLAFDIDSSGDAIGKNATSAVGQGKSRTYTFWVPRDPEMEGAHYINPGSAFRNQISHGLFGSLAVEPAGSTWRDMVTGGSIDSGWQADVMPCTDPKVSCDATAPRKAFREYVQLYHEVGNEKEDISDKNGGKLPRVDPHTESYRPGARAINYRSEPFMDRLNQAPEEEAHGYGSYTFADPATPMPRGYQADPSKIRILHAGSEMFHVFHLHGGGIRWRLNPHADSTYDYQDTGLAKHPVSESNSARLDSQAFGPGESYDLEIEGGAGGVQQGAGEFLFHCHIAEHYVSGMWSFWRVFDTLQPDLKPLPDRTAPPTAVSSDELIGRTMPDGTTLTAANLDKWIRPQLPAQGKPLNSQDGAVWNWQTTDSPSGANTRYLGEPEDTTPWPDNTDAQDARDNPNFVAAGNHPSFMPGDVAVGADSRPEIRFNPVNGRPAYPLLRPHIGKRPPFSGNGHTGAPYLGENADQAKTTPDGTPDPFAGRKDGLCPAGAPVRHFNIVALDVNSPVTRKTSDPDGKVYVLAQDAADVLAGRKPVTPLAIRGNIGDCIAVTLTSEMTDAKTFGGFSKVSLHIHHVQFDTQSSDGPITGLSYEQSVRPFKAEDVQLDTGGAAAGAKSFTVTNPTATQPDRLAKLRPGVWIAVGQGTESIEQAEIATVDPGTAPNTAKITLVDPLKKDHAAGEWTGTEFLQSRWYPDVQLDNIFWHDHVDGIHSWGHGLVGQLIIEPKGSTYHDPATGAEIASGQLADIYTSNPLAPGLVSGDFREFAMWTLDENPVTDSTINLRAEPWADRGGDPSLRFSSYAHGDPWTVIPKAYAGDPFVIRTINVGPSVDSFHIDGHRFFLENRYAPAAAVTSTPTDSIHYGISERYTAILQGGAGGTSQEPGDYLFMNGVGRRFQQGAWGLLRVLPGQTSGLRPLPDRAAPTGTALALPAASANARPPAAAADGGSAKCATGAPVRKLTISAVDVPGSTQGRSAAFVPSEIAADVKSGKVSPEPLVAHVAAGDCVIVTFNNERAKDRASFHATELQHGIDSSGINVGFNKEQTVAPGGQRTYQYYADTRKIGSALISDFGGDDTGRDGLYGAFEVAPAGATFTNPKTGEPAQYGQAMDVHVPGSQGYRDFTAMMSDADPIIGGSFMPYPNGVSGPALLNYHSDPRPSDANAFSSDAHGDPTTPLFSAYGGDPMKVHFFVAPGSEQTHVATIGGQYFPMDPEIAGSNAFASQGLAPWETVDAEVRGGAGGLMRAVGDFLYGDARKPFTEAGMWGLMRVMSDPSCPIKPLDGGLTCIAQPSIITDPPALPRPGEAAVGDFAAAQDQPLQSPLGAAVLRGSTRPTVAGSLARSRGARNLRIARRLSLVELGTRGLRIRMTTPANTRLVVLQLMQRNGKRLTARISGRVRIRRGGTVTVQWKPGRNAVARLRSGQYVLRVRVGPDRTRLSGATVQASVRLTGRPPATAGNRRR
jgi:FtsP/CotA-like multicopper oxidase with cupredoxin domain